MNIWDKFEETRLPSIDKLYSKLKMSGIIESEYQHARNVWDKFNLKNMGDYHDLYLKTDVILLTNAFELFRSVCLSNYGLDPAHFYTAPRLAWKACLKKTCLNLEIVKDPEILLMFERGIRGGITQSVHRWAIANNSYMGCEYDPSEPTEFLQYLDANNLYGWAMSQPSPVGDFKWIKIDNEESDIVEKLNKNSKLGYGYLLEVDVDYPLELHDYHNDLPFLCKKIKVNGVEEKLFRIYTIKRNWIGVEKDS